MSIWEQRMPRGMSVAAVKCVVCGGGNPSHQSICQHCHASLVGIYPTPERGIDEENKQASGSALGLFGRMFLGKYFPAFDVRAAWPWIIGTFWIILILWSFYYL